VTTMPLQEVNSIESLKKVPHNIIGFDQDKFIDIVTSEIQSIFDYLINNKLFVDKFPQYMPQKIEIIKKQKCCTELLNL
jgi:hypothetical protein